MNPVLVETVVKGAVLLGLTFAVLFCLRREAPATRHRVLKIAMVALIALPILAVTMPAIDLAVLSNEIQQVLKSNLPVERELELGDRVYLVRLIPLDDQASAESGGLIISFIEATETIFSARESQRFATVLKDSSVFGNKPSRRHASNRSA